MTCWAAALGGCDSKTSREHLVSDGLWDGPRIRVQGLPWCRDEPKIVGRNALTAKILCRSHNSALSPVDTAGRDAFRALANAAKFADNRTKITARTWIPFHFRIDGQLLERWFLKTLINLVYLRERPLPWSIGGSTHAPPGVLIDAVFGVRALSKPLGLYGVAVLGEAAVSSDKVEFRPLLTLNGSQIAGGLFFFRGFRYLLHTDDTPLDPTLRITKEGGTDWNGSAALYHIRNMDCNIAGALSHSVDYAW